MKILFVSWDGPQVTYLEGLFLPIFAALQAQGFEFHVLQFTWADRESIQRTRAMYEAAGVGYRSVHVLRYPKAVGAVVTAWWGSKLIARTIRRHGIDAVMPRSILPAFATMLVRGIGKIPIVFDADGLAIDERVDFARESTSSVEYRVMRDVEVEAVRRADVVLTRTKRAADVLHARAGSGTLACKFHVVGNGRDSKHFHPYDQPARERLREHLGIPVASLLLVHAGSLGEQYCPTQMLDLFAKVLQRRPDAQLLVLSRQGESLQALAADMHIPADAVTVMALQPEQVPAYLACADVGLALRKPSFSMQGVAPIKLGEYLLCGVPVVVSTVIAKAELIDAGTGLRLDDIDHAALERVANWIVDEVQQDREGFRQRCVALGLASFSLGHSIDGYLRAFSTISSASIRQRESAVATDEVGRDSNGRLPLDRNRQPARCAVPASVLYLSYDGMLEPLGQSQVLAYLEKLAATRDIHLLSFEKSGDWADEDQRKRIQSRIAAAGIHWHPRRYHKQPSSLATAWDIFIGTLSTLWLVLRHRIRIIHARSYVVAIMAWVVTGLTGAKFLFDMRGFWADERIDGGLWPRDGRMYRVAKWFERKFLLNADHVVSLTQAGVREMQAFDYLQGRMPPLSIIPTCANLQRFKPMAAPRDKSLVLGYVGSVGTWYMFDSTVACFLRLLKLRPDARMLIINRNEHAYIRERMSAGGIADDAYELRSASHADMPAQMARMHITAFFIKPVFSKQASAPTKLAEFLGCGIPCLSNSGVGDMAQILESGRVGVAVDSFEPEALDKGLLRLLALLDEPDIHERCAAVAHRHFSLEQGVSDYQGIYASLVKAR